MHMSNTQVAYAERARARKADALVATLEQLVAKVEGRRLRPLTDDSDLILSAAQALDADGWQTVAAFAKVNPPSDVTVESIMWRLRRRVADRDRDPFAGLT